MHGQSKLLWIRYGLFLGLILCSVQPTTVQACDSTLLRLAVQLQDYSRIKYLLSQGCSVNSTEDGTSIYNIAVMSGCSMYTLEYLKQLGAKPSGKGTNRLTSAYLDAVSAGEKDPISAAFKGAGILFEKSACSVLGEPYPAVALYLNAKPIEQRPDLKDKLAIEQVFISTPNRPERRCPKAAQHSYFETNELKFSLTGTSYQVSGLKVFCCK